MERIYYGNKTKNIILKENIRRTHGRGTSAHRTTVTKDIAELQEFGIDIVTIHSTQSKYFVASRKFELPELKLMIERAEQDLKQTEMR